MSCSQTPSMSSGAGKDIPISRSAGRSFHSSGFSGGCGMVAEGVGSVAEAL